MEQPEVWRALKYGLAGVLVLLVWLLWPWYQFEAHSGKAPFPPFGWESMEGEAPSTQASYDPRYARAGNRVLARAEQHRKSIGAPAISLAVAIDGELVWHAATGWADLSSRAPATPDTRFRVGSTSKAITGTALARLVDKGVIDIDAPLSRYFEEIANPQWADITPRQLASHMAGVPHYGDNRDWSGLYQTVALRKHYTSMHEAIEVFDGSPLLFEPGTDFSYSSLGTVLLGATMAAAADKPYLQIVEEEVLSPAGMMDTIVAPAKSDGADNIATFYYRDDNRYRVWRPVDLSHRMPGGGFASTPTDLVRMGNRLLDDSFIKPQTREAFWTPQRLSNGEVNEQDYAIGWRWREWDVEGVGVARNANHGGVSRGSQSWLLVFPDYNMAIAMCTNARTPEFYEFGALYEDVFREFALAGVEEDDARPAQ